MPQILLPEVPCGKDPIVIVSTRNPDSSINLAKLAPAINQLMRTTGSQEFAAMHRGQGLRYTRAKFAAAKLTPCRSFEISTAGVEECPIRVEAELVHVRSLPDKSVKALELRVIRVNIDTSIVKVDSQREIDMEKWHPLQAHDQDLCVAPGQAPHQKTQIGHCDDVKKDIQIPLTRATLGLRARSLVKAKAPRARYPVLAASPSATSLRALHDTAEPIAADSSNDVMPEADAAGKLPTDAGPGYPVVTKIKRNEK
ncbi:MAG: hypothetical protein Q9221_002727 [Calogaya cf. arnoldii]